MENRRWLGQGQGGSVDFGESLRWSKDGFLDDKERQLRKQEKRLAAWEEVIYWHEWQLHYWVLTQWTSCNSLMNRQTPITQRRTLAFTRIPYHIPLQDVSSHQGMAYEYAPRSN